ncbi:MAG: GAF domain-containing protein, partial [Anaerolineae bacterium]
MAKAQILIVEDEIIIAESIRNRLENLDYDVLAVVASGEEAIEKAGETHLNLVLMDIDLAGDMDGIEAAEQIRARFHIPVIYLTAFADDETLRRAKITEPYGYILKPLQLRDLRTNIEMALYKHEMESKLRESEERYRQFVENSPNPVFSVDRDGIIQTWNRACEQIFQYESGEIVGQAYHKLLWNSKDRPAVNTMLAQVWQGHSLSNENMAYRSKDGTRHFTVSRLYPLRDPERNVLRCVFANTDVTERRRAETELRQRTAQLEALREMGLELTAELDLDALLHSIATWAVELLGGAAGSLDIYRPDRNVLELAIDTSGSTDAVAGNVTHVPGEGLSGKVWESGEALIVGDYERWEGRLAGWKGDSVIASVLGVPICWHEEFLGVLSVASDVLDAFSPDDVELLNLLANQAAIAIRNARLFDEARRRAERLTVVNRIAGAASDILHLDDLTEIVCQEIAAIFQADAFFIALYDKEANELDFLFLMDEGVRVPIGRSPLRGLTALVVAGKKPLVIRNLEQEPDYRQVAISVGGDKRAASWIGVPLLVGEQVIGVLNVQSYQPNAWGEEDELLLLTIADQVAMAIKSVRLYEETRQRAIEQETASHIAYALNTLDFQTAFPVLVQGLRNLTDCERVSLALLDDTGENFTMTALESPFPALEERSSMPLSATSAFKDMATGRPHLTPDLSAETDLPGEQALYQAGFRSRINLPLL